MTLLTPEKIGNPECPLMLRWTLLAGKRGKLLLHHFMPDVQDPDVHDHPRSLLIFVLRGFYDDMVLCPNCRAEKGKIVRSADPVHTFATTIGSCPLCEGKGLVVGDRMHAGMVRYRKAEHAHATHAGPKGAWTVCIMGPVVREWGFWINGQWENFRKYIDTRGFVRRCPAED